MTAQVTSLSITLSVGVPRESTVRMTMAEKCPVPTFQQPWKDVGTETTQQASHILVSPPQSLYKLVYMDGEKADTARRMMLGGNDQGCFIDKVIETESDHELEWDNYFSTYTDDGDFGADIISTTTERTHPSVVSPMYLALPSPDLMYQNLLQKDWQSVVLQHSSSAPDMCSETFGQQSLSIGSTSSSIGNTSSQTGRSGRDDSVIIQKGLVRQRSQEIRNQTIRNEEDLDTENDDGCQGDKMPSKERRDGVYFHLQNAVVQTSTALKGRLVYMLTCLTVKITKAIVHILWWLG
ncbi:Hypp1464 [Branchiostoma lanceolatum]|uniref:Hypp1464 protein n=1 Tax=Branchiostoma lanceolatum TaxID=7740 RepID=A0A8K0ENG8_BRALA|nr:Hypp1464 [Branchiostoma lanceolatum]